MHKFGELRGTKEVSVNRPAVFVRAATTGPERLCIAVPASGPDPLHSLVACLEEPFSVLYLLHTPRGEHEPGRYESPPLSREHLLTFLSTYHAFFATDGRHDVWVHSFSPPATLVWDRHDIVYAYGPLDQFQAALTEAGFTPGVPAIPDPHCHHYHAAFDPQEAAVIEAFLWRQSPLLPEDEQVRAT